MRKNELMQLALNLAKNGGDKTFPNPNVGAVIFKDGKIVGQGYHRFFGDSHAEIHALNQAGDKAKGSTLFVTLEPCSHFGKTPPCVDAIIKAGIKKVIVGIKDPNPFVNGRGIQILENAGIEVETNVLGKKIEKFYKSYSERFFRKDSYVVLKYAMTLDGKIATITGDSKWISSDKSREWVHNFRTKFDGILVGVNTILKDDPELSSHNKGKNPVRIVIDPKLKAPLSARILNDDLPTCLIYSKNVSQKKLREIKGRNKFLIKLNEENGRISFNQILEELSKISIFSILIEGGGTTAWNALKDNIVDEIITFISPKIVGGKKSITPVEGEGVELINESIKTKFIELRKFGEDVFIRSKVIKQRK
jgi:diaminohydroxyphosphoribosylaminopyrimidine deaminase/5-amino-6-(5-phosphoribosylamino)uracil reductase